MSDEDPGILIVDDRRDKLLALSAALDGVCTHIATATSGRDALKLLLERSFAVILLDVNMPGMDGFETASLIRQRESSESTPIIFITSFGDDMHVSRGYSLGAVDYILAPVVPEVLRTKVSVFLDLGRKTREVVRQAARLQQRADQLHKLSQASLAIHSAMSMDKMLQVITDMAREIIGAHRATAVTTWDENWARCKKTLSLSPQLEGRRSLLSPASGSELHALWLALGRAGRLCPSELQAHPAWQSLGRSLWDSHEAPDWLAAPLTGRDGRDMGLLHVCGRIQGEFTAEDEAVLLQLAQMASIAIENTLNSEAREANRIKDEFLATLSHELRTPLTAMLGWTQLLRTGKVAAEETARGLEVIERNVLAQAKLIDDLLDVSRIITGKLKLSVRPLSLVEVIEAAIDVVRPAANAKGIQLVPDLDAAAGQSSGDPDRLQQVVWNLLVNAVKFSSAGSQVRVTLTRYECRSRIEVADAGEGIEKEFLPHIFDRFRQADSSTRRSHGGLGLGLAIVRHVVELHGGSVRAYSDGAGRGSKFTVDLPAAMPLADGGDVRPAVSAPRPATAPAVDFNLAGLRVLVVDDEPDGRETIAKVLTVYQAEVTSASSVAEALVAFHKSPPDVLVSDIGMPEQDGYDLIREIRRLPPEKGGRIPAMALTAFAREEDRLQALAAGFQTHATKPIEPAELVAGVARLAGRTATAASPNGNGSYASHPLVATR
ncbi:MAG TPA: response regulator [Pirellulales bacterium]|nr:response regulator [Pirellulales bacterium]